MNEIIKSIPELFFEREPINMPPRLDIADVVFKKTARQFEQAFIEVTGHVQKQKPSNIE